MSGSTYMRYTPRQWMAWESSRWKFLSQPAVSAVLHPDMELKLDASLEGPVLFNMVYLTQRTQGTTSGCHEETANGTRGSAMTWLLQSIVRQITTHEQCPQLHWVIEEQNADYRGGEGMQIDMKMIACSSRRWHLRLTPIHTT